MSWFLVINLKTSKAFHYGWHDNRIMCIDKYLWRKNLKSGEKSLKRMPNLQNAMKRTRFRICLTNETYKSLDSIWFFMWIIISFNMISDIQHSQELWRPLNINRRNIGCGGRAQNMVLPHLQGNIEIGRHKDRNAEVGNTKHRIYRN